tara:strand:+ start:12164 stop:12688 length:525 start_codon:yes stop_codon:yes gene_type:complete
MILKELELVHQIIAKRFNASTTTIIQSAMLGKDFFSSVPAALLTLGNIHAPLSQTNKLLSSPNPITEAYSLLSKGYKVPGWGSSFVKGEPDPVFDRIKSLLKEKYPDKIEIVDEISKMLNLFPNASCYTVLSHWHIKKDLVDTRSIRAAEFLITSRMPVWTDLYIEHYKQGCES